MLHKSVFPPALPNLCIGSMFFLCHFAVTQDLYWRPSQKLKMNSPILEKANHGALKLVYTRISLRPLALALAHKRPGALARLGWTPSAKYQPALRPDRPTHWSFKAAAWPTKQPLISTALSNSLIANYQHITKDSTNHNAQFIYPQVPPKLPLLPCRGPLSIWKSCHTSPLLSLYGVDTPRRVLSTNFPFPYTPSSIRPLSTL